MKFDITWTITAIIAVSSFLSPIAVAIINNCHHTKIRKLELKHDEKLRMLDLQQQSAIRQCDIYYADKKQAFADFIVSACAFFVELQFSESFEKFESALNKSLLFCLPETQRLLLKFLSYANTLVSSDRMQEQIMTEYFQRLSSIAVSLNAELESTKPVMNCE